MKHARDMDEAERQAALAEIKRGPLPEPMPPTDKTAAEMTESERQSFIKELKKRFG